MTNTIASDSGNRRRVWRSVRSQHGEPSGVDGVYSERQLGLRRGEVQVRVWLDRPVASPHHLAGLEPVEEPVDLVGKGVVVGDPFVERDRWLSEPVTHPPQRGEAHGAAVEVPVVVASDHQAEVVLDETAGSHQRVLGRVRRVVGEPLAREPRNDLTQELVSGRLGSGEAAEHRVGSLGDQPALERQLHVASVVGEQPCVERRRVCPHVDERIARSRVELVQPGGRPVALHHRVVDRNVGRVLEQVGRQASLRIEGDGHALQVRASRPPLIKG